VEYGAGQVASFNPTWSGQVAAYWLSSKMGIPLVKEKQRLAGRLGDTR